MAPYNAGMAFPTTILAVNSVGLALSLLAVSLRMWSRFIRRTKLRLSDYTIVASWLFTFGLVVSENFCVTHGGVGQKILTVKIEELLFSTKQFLVIGVTGTLAVTLVKISILDLFLSIFSSHHRFEYAAYTLMGITAAYGTSFTIVTLAGCRPFQANWDKLSYPDYKCINTSQFYVAQAAIGAVLDCLILLLPLPIVWKLKLKTSKKIGLTVLFTTGILICAISIARLVYNTRETYMLTHFTEYAGIAAILGALEANLSIVCACLPLIQPIITSLSEKIKTTFGSDKSLIRGVLNPFSSKSRKNTRGSMKLDSSADRKGSSLTDEEMDTSRLRKQHDKLYPLSMTTGTQASMDEEAGWAEQMRGDKARGDTVISARGERALEMQHFQHSAEQNGNISVTKTWAVN